jgi:hypothetical protein
VSPWSVAAGQVDGLVAGVPQRRGRRLGAGAGAADHDDLGVLGQGLVLGFEAAERQVGGLGRVARLPLAVLAHVEQEGAGVEAAEGLGRVDLGDAVVADAHGRRTYRGNATHTSSSAITTKAAATKT